MQNLQGSREPACLDVAAPGRQFRHPLQSDGRQKEQRQPCARAHEAGLAPKKNPGDAGDAEDKEGGVTPRGSCFRSPAARQHSERGNDCQEQEDVIKLDQTGRLKVEALGGKSNKRRGGPARVVIERDGLRVKVGNHANHRHLFSRRHLFVVFLG